ncbi:hypothetical protein ABW20_dc0106875 [Dactylellina cionopaga]|nr:hypothetical protein ABW20_dc0106875 [Dactylellina cionopaga]
MARKDPRSVYAPDKYEDDQEDLYSDPYRDAHPHGTTTTTRTSSTPAPQLSSSNNNYSPTSGSFSDKENAPVKPKHRGSDTSPLVKKERGLIAQSARSAPYAIPSNNMSPAKSRASRASVVSRASTAAVSQKSRQSRATSKTLSRAASATVSRASSRAASRVPETPEEESQGEDEDEAEEEDGDEEEEDEEDEITSAQQERAEESESTPEPTQRSRIPETPGPSRPQRSAQSQIQPGSQVPPSTQKRDSTQFYDPNQSMVERRRVKASYNELQQDLIDNREQFLRPGNTDLIHYIEKTTDLFTDVKQTGDAMVDGKIQVEIGRIAAEKAKRVGNSNTNTGLDIDEFIAKCVQFMAKSRPGDTSDGHDWSHIGREAATPAMRRACPSDFMYGPMKIQKRQRLVKERKRVVRRRPEEFIKPIDLDEKQIAKNENSTTKNVVHINECLEQYLTKNDMEAVSYFKFIINPHSYSQTIENMFYLAFLVRDGRVAITESEDGEIPYLVPTEPPSPEDAIAEGVVRQQIVMPMEKRIWRELIDAFQIKDTIVPTRPREVEAINGSGWYS